LLLHGHKVEEDVHRTLRFLQLYLKLKLTRDYISSSANIGHGIQLQVHTAVLDSKRKTPHPQLSITTWFNLQLLLTYVNV